MTVSIQQRLLSLTKYRLKNCEQNLSVKNETLIIVNKLECCPNTAYIAYTAYTTCVTHGHFFSAHVYALTYKFLLFTVLDSDLQRTSVSQ